MRGYLPLLIKDARKQPFQFLDCVARGARLSRRSPDIGLANNRNNKQRGRKRVTRKNTARTQPRRPKRQNKGRNKTRNARPRAARVQQYTLPTRLGVTNTTGTKSESMTVTRYEEVAVIKDCNAVQPYTVEVALRIDSNMTKQMASFANMYDRISDLTVKVDIIPQTGTEARNGYIAAFNDDPDDEIPSTYGGKQRLLALPGAKESSYTRPMTISKRYKGTKFTVGDTGEGENSEARLKAWGRLHLMLLGPSGINPGGTLAIRIQWTARFSKPTLQINDSGEELPSFVWHDDTIKIPAFSTPGASNIIYRKSWGSMLPKSYWEPNWEHSIWRISSATPAVDSTHPYTHGPEQGAEDTVQTYRGFAIVVRDSDHNYHMTPLYDPGWDDAGFSGDNTRMPKTAMPFTNTANPTVTLTFDSYGDAHSKPPTGFRQDAARSTPSATGSGNSSLRHSISSRAQAQLEVNNSSRTSNQLSSYCLRSPYGPLISKGEYVEQMTRLVQRTRALDL